MVTFIACALEYDVVVLDGEEGVFIGGILYKQFIWPVLPQIGSEWVLEPEDKSSGLIDRIEHNPFDNTIEVEMKVTQLDFQNLCDDPSWSKSRPTG